MPSSICSQVRFVLTDIDDTITQAGQLPASSLNALESLSSAGFQVIPVTGRPAGWCDHIARMWPVDAIVGENGAFWMSYDREKRKMRIEFAQDEVTRLQNQQKLLQLREQILAEVPGVGIASDQNYRIADLAIDFCEDVAPLASDQVQKIVNLFHQAGAVAKVSSIHVNGWFGNYDKLSMTRELLRDVFDFDIDSENQHCVFIGDSPNDQPMFRFFDHSIGVANVSHFPLEHPPTWIAKAHSAAGFQEIVNILLQGRKGKQQFLEYPEVNEEEKFLIRLAWAYYTEGLTQAEVAKRFGVTRLRVNKSLGEVKRRGFVRFTINSRYSPCIQLEHQLKETFGLKEALVAPLSKDSDNHQIVVGKALAQFLSDFLRSSKIKSFGMSWSGTLNITTHFMRPINRPDLEIVSIMGGLSKGADPNSFEISARLAGLCNAKHCFLTAPLYASTKQSRNTIRQQDVLSEILNKVKKVDAAVIAAGDLSSRSLLVKEGLPKDIIFEELIEQGAVGDILGCVLDEEGKPIDHNINDRIIGMQTSDLPKIETVILAAGGKHKVPIIRTALNAKLSNILITDEHTAQQLLQVQN